MLWPFLSMMAVDPYCFSTESQIVNFLKGLKAGILAIFLLGHKNDHQREKKHCYNSCKIYILLLWKTKQWTNKKFEEFLAWKINGRSKITDGSHQSTCTMAGYCLILSCFEKSPTQHIGYTLTPALLTLSKFGKWYCFLLYKQLLMWPQVMVCLNFKKNFFIARCQAWTKGCLQAFDGHSAKRIIPAKESHCGISKGHIIMVWSWCCNKNMAVCPF